jgi:hypothetical protein
MSNVTIPDENQRKSGDVYKQEITNWNEEYIYQNEHEIACY